MDLAEYPMNLNNQKSLFKHLLIIEQPKERKSLLLEDYQYTIGRKSNNNIVINSHQISRKHATLLKKTKSQSNQFSYWILDGDLEGNKSQNGLYVNGEKCLVHELKDGDLINFGCEVNASYHILHDSEKMTGMINSFNPLVEKNKETQEKLTYPGSEIPKVLFISDPHLAVINDDTLPDQVYLDLLTELPNRSLFQQYLSIAIENAKQNQKNLAILYFDIEKLKTINEQFGNKIGDQVLQQFAKQLKSCLRSGDIVARWGGDEFTILLSQINSEEDLPKISQRIINKLTQPLKLEEKTINIHTNVGFAIYPQDGNNEKKLIENADKNLVSKKKENKNKVKGQNVQLSKIESLLQQAFKNQEFYLDYQPQMNIKTNTIEGMEALLRWHHPQSGVIAPRQFIPWIEKLDLTISITQWIIKTVAQQHQVWRELGLINLPISINLSTHQLQHPSLLEILNQTLSETGLEPNLLIMEITEKTLLENAENVVRVLYELKQIGVKEAIDDFGAGTTSVRLLQQFPFDQIKIAQSLMQDLKKYPDEISMIAAVTALGRIFNLKVIAEGVETPKQQEILRKFGCEIMQGYLFSKPLKATEATQFLCLHQCTGQV